MVDGKEHRVDYEPGRIAQRALRRKLQLARPDLVSGQLPAHRVAAEVSPLPRRRLQGRVPTGSGNYVTLAEVAAELSRRLTRIFLRDASGRRPALGVVERFQNDPHFRDLVLFHEYFHGDNGAGIGASHQTGWTGLVVKLLQQTGE